MQITYTTADGQKVELPFFTEARSIASVLRDLNFDTENTALSDYLTEVVHENNLHTTAADPIFVMLGALFQAVTYAIIRSTQDMDSDGIIGPKNYADVLERYLQVAYGGVQYGIDLLDLVDAIAHVNKMDPDVARNVKAKFCV